MSLENFGKINILITVKKGLIRSLALLDAQFGMKMWSIKQYVKVAFPLTTGDPVVNPSGTNFYLGLLISANFPQAKIEIRQLKTGEVISE